jgi:hypothetical protein
MRTIRSAVALMLCLLALNTVGCGDLPADEEPGPDAGAAVTQESAALSLPNVPALPTGTVTVTPDLKKCDAEEIACIARCNTTPIDWVGTYNKCMLGCIDGFATCRNKVNAPPSALANP